MGADAVRVRLGVPADLEVMVDIERETAVEPWSLSQFLNSSLDERHFSLVAESNGGDVLGYAIFQQVLDEASLLNIAIDPAHQGRGLGGQLLAGGLEMLAARGVQRCLLEVRVGNAPAIALYRGFGFVDDGLRRNYYPSTQGREHALLMSRTLDVPQ